MTNAETIQRIEYHDDGDGSMTVQIMFVDGSEFAQNVDVDYDNGSFSERQENGKMSYPDRIEVS